MSFKIVQTRETNGAKKLSVIPSLWEKNGQMQWPASTKQITQTKFNVMSQDANSVPPPEWPHFKCTMKREVQIHADAVAIMKEMSGESDTQPSDSDAMPPPPPPPSVQKRNAALQKKQIPVANFQEMVKKCVLFLPCFDHFNFFRSHCKGCWK